MPTHYRSRRRDGSGRHHGYRPHHRAHVSSHGDPIRFPHSSSSWLDGSRVRGPSREALELLTDPTAKPSSKCPSLDTQEAFGKAHERLKGYSRTETVCTDHRHKSYHDKWWLPFMIFDELDKELFCSVLKGNVYVKWSESPPGVYAATSRADLKSPRITIELSKLLLENSRVTILATLLHQMIHAYYLQCCGYKDEGVEGVGHDLHHGLEFDVLARNIKEGFLPNMKFSLRDPLDTWKKSSGSSSGRDERTSHGQANLGTTYCSQVLSVTTANECKKWREDAITLTKSLALIAKAGLGPGANASDKALSSPPSKSFFFIKENGIEDLPQLRSKFGSSPDKYIELHFEDKVYPLQRERLCDLPALSKSPFLTNKRVLNFPSTFARTDFRTLYLFLLFKRFDPTLKPSLVHSSILISEKGPPVILPYVKESTQYLTGFITAVQLAATLNFPSLGTHAITYLQNLPYTENDPTAALAQIYYPENASPPAPELRAWVRSWLAHRLSDIVKTLYSNAYDTNLAVIQHHPDLKEKYASLQQKSKGKELATDIETVEKELDRASRPPPAPLRPALLAGQPWTQQALQHQRQSPYRRSPSQHVNPHASWQQQQRPETKTQACGCAATHVQRHDQPSQPSVEEQWFGYPSTPTPGGPTPYFPTVRGAALPIEDVPDFDTRLFPGAHLPERLL